MLPLLNLQIGELRSLETLNPADLAMPEGTDTLEGTFADILRLRAEAPQDAGPEVGAMLPQGGNELPLLPLLVDETAPVPVSDAGEQIPAELPDVPGTDPVAIVDAVLVADIVPGADVGQAAVTIAANPAAVPGAAQALRPIDAEPALPSAQPASVSNTVSLPNVGAMPEESAPIITQRAEIQQRSGRTPPPDTEALDQRRPVTDSAAPQNLRPETLLQPSVNRSPARESAAIPVNLPNSREPHGDARPAVTTTSIESVHAGIRDEASALQRVAAPHVPQPVPINVEAPLPGDGAARFAIDAPTATPRPAAFQPLMQAVDMPVLESGWDKLISERVLLMANGRLQNAELRLTPAELGPLRVQVTVEDGAAHVAFQAQHALTREAIEQAMPRLREMLADSGLSLGQTSVSDDGVRQGGRDGAAPGNEAGAAAREEGEYDEEHVAVLGARSSDGLVDTFA